MSSRSRRSSAEAPTWALIAGGGTAGHLLPGLAVARALEAAGRNPASIHFVGSDRGVEATLVPAAGFTFDELPGRGIQRRLTLANVGAVIGLIRGLFQGIVIVRRRRPAVVIALGGHASFACGLAAVILRCPLVLLEQNVRAGAVNRLLGRFATASAVSFAGTDLPRSVVTGNPLRPEIRAASGAAVEINPDAVSDSSVHAQARAELGLPADRLVVAVFSGSLGSARINTAVRGLVERWRDRSDLAVRHVIGRRDFDKYTTDLPEFPQDGLIYQVVAYEERMHLLLASADVAVTRAGGGVAELTAMGVPAVLVPLPIATRDHQTANAGAVAAAGAAVMIPDAECTVDRLEAELGALLDDPDRLATMAAAARAYSMPDAAERVALLVEKHARV